MFLLRRESFQLVAVLQILTIRKEFGPRTANFSSGLAMDCFLKFCGKAVEEPDLGPMVQTPQAP